MSQCVYTSLCKCVQTCNMRRALGPICCVATRSSRDPCRWRAGARRTRATPRSTRARVRAPRPGTARGAGARPSWSRRSRSTRSTSTAHHPTSLITPSCSCSPLSAFNREKSLTQLNSRLFLSQGRKSEHWTRTLNACGTVDSRRDDAHCLHEVEPGPLVRAVLRRERVVERYVEWVRRALRRALLHLLAYNNALLSVQSKCARYQTNLSLQ